MMRIMLLALTNLAVMVVLYLTMNILGRLFGFQMNAGSMSTFMIMALLMGFGGSFVSLLMSKSMAKEKFRKLDL